MGLALSSSHHYSSQPRVRAQSDRHSSSNALQLILVKVSKIQNPKVSEILIRTSLRAIIVLRILLRVDILPKAMWNITLYTSKLRLSLPQQHHLPSPMPQTPRLLCVLRLAGIHIGAWLFYRFLTNTQESLQDMSFFFFFFFLFTNPPIWKKCLQVCGDIMLSVRFILLVYHS